MANALVSIALQLAVVLLIAGAVRLASGRREPFARWIGFVPTTARAAGLAVLLGLGAVLLLVAVPSVRELGRSPNSVVGKAIAGGVTTEALVVLVLSAVLKTALSEEIFFRGLLGKRLINKLGFRTGNLIQAALFGAIHLTLFLAPEATPGTVWLMVAVTGVMGWVNGWLNERVGNGSILPGWIVHGLANLVSYLTLALRLV